MPRRGAELCEARRRSRNREGGSHFLRAPRSVHPRFRNFALPRFRASVVHVGRSFLSFLSRPRHPAPALSPPAWPPLRPWIGGILKKRAIFIFGAPSARNTLFPAVSLWGAVLNNLRQGLAASETLGRNEQWNRVISSRRCLGFPLFLAAACRRPGPPSDADGRQERQQTARDSFSCPIR